MGEVHTTTVRALRILTDAIRDHRTHTTYPYRTEHDERLYAEYRKARDLLEEITSS